MSDFFHLETQHMPYDEYYSTLGLRTLDTCTASSLTDLGLYFSPQSWISRVFFSVLDAPSYVLSSEIDMSFFTFDFSTKLSITRKISKDESI